jgi:hypothetical protein
MKKIGTYTARGILNELETEAGLPQKISLFDGLFTTAYRVIKFEIFPATFSSSSQPDCIGKLSKNEFSVTSNTNFWRADDDNQIARSGTGGDIDSLLQQTSFIDLDNMIVEDLYVYARTRGDQANAVNYIVTMEKYQISDWKGALTMARDKAQE